MNDLIERLAYLLIGGFFGFIAGYVVRSLRDIRREVHEVDEIVTKQYGKSNEDGTINEKFATNIALAFVVILTVFAAFASQHASNEVADTQDSYTQMAECNKVFLSQTIVALNERTTYTTAQVQSNVDLQKAQASLYALLLRLPPEPVVTQRAAATKYLHSLREFTSLSSKAVHKVETNPFPTDTDLAECLAAAKKKD